MKDGKRVLVEYWLRKINPPRKNSKTGKFEAVGGSGHRAIAVCLIVDPETKKAGRGFAILSPNDAFNGREGKRLARSRAWRALYSDTPKEYVSQRIALNTMFSVFANRHEREEAKKRGLREYDFLFKVFPNPTLSEMEKGILERRLK